MRNDDPESILNHDIGGRHKHLRERSFLCNQRLQGRPQRRGGGWRPKSVRSGPARAPGAPGPAFTAAGSGSASLLAGCGGFSPPNTVFDRFDLAFCHPAAKNFKGVAGTASIRTEGGRKTALPICEGGYGVGTWVGPLFFLARRQRRGTSSRGFPCRPAARAVRPPSGAADSTNGLVFLHTRTSALTLFASPYGTKNVDKPYAACFAEVGNIPFCLGPDGGR